MLNSSDGLAGDWADVEMRPNSDLLGMTVLSRLSFAVELSVELKAVKEALLGSFLRIHIRYALLPIVARLTALKKTSLSLTLN